MSMWFGCRMPLFLNFSYFITYINSFNHIHTIHLSVAICRGGLFPCCFVSSVGKTSLWCRDLYVKTYTVYNMYFRVKQF